MSSVDGMFEDADGASNPDQSQEVLSAAEVLQRLERAWLNEKFAPEILENKSEIVDCMLEQIREMEENIKRAKKGDFRVTVHRMEIDRIRYMICDYLRIRLRKIEENALHIIDSPVDSSRLTPEEHKFAREYWSSVENHFTSVALRHMPPNLQSLDRKLAAVRPNLNSYVFMRVNKSVAGVMVEEETDDVGEEIMDLVEGDQHIMRYKPLKALVDDSSVQLI